MVHAVASIFLNLCEVDMVLLVMVVSVGVLGLLPEHMRADSEYAVA